MSAGRQKASVPTVDELRATMEALGTWEDRFSYIIDVGKRLPELGEDERVEANLVRGCQARVWMVLGADGGCLRVRAASDSQLVNGLIGVLVSIYDGVSIEGVGSIDAEGFVRELGFEEHLTSVRRNGLHAMIGRIRSVAGDGGVVRA